MKNSTCDVFAEVSTACQGWEANCLRRYLGVVLFPGPEALEALINEGGAVWLQRRARRRQAHGPGVKMANTNDPYIDSLRERYNK